MTPTQILKSQDFTEVAEVRPDDKKRLLLKKVKNAGKMYRIFENPLGQLILDPIVTIPRSEAWLYQNKVAISSVRKGLTEAGEGKLRKRPSRASR
jgi:hypothetical protein